MTSAFTAKFHTPPQDLAAPTLFVADRESLLAWLETLPKANLGQSTRALYHAITELNRVRLLPSLRLQLLETLRPAIHFSTTGLRRHYLNQPTMLPEQPQKVARLAHVLHEQLATGYILAATHTIALGKQSGFSQPQQAITTSVHRGIVEHNQNLLRDYQLYRNPHPGCWFSIHQLALLARECNVQHVVVADDQCGDSSGEAAYLRALLLGSAKFNQLRQDDLARIYQHILNWIDLAHLTHYEQGLLAINPNSDDGPIYREFAKPDASWLGLETSALAHHLADLRERSEGNLINDHQLSTELLAHLAHTWGSTSTRSFTRMGVDEQVDIALGLTAAHHYISGELDFNLLLNRSGHSKLTVDDENPFLRTAQPGTKARGSRDVWDTPYQPSAGVNQVSLDNIDYHLREQHQKTAIEKEREKFRCHTVDRVNVSPSGLCVKWPHDSAAQIRAGEIVGVREKNQKNWSIGAIRWVRLTESGPQLGIELLSPNGVPYGARALNKSGALGDFQRALVLPEVKQTGQPTTLITPRLPFRTGQKVSLLCDDKETRVQLTRKIAATGSFSQFEFRRLSAVAKTAEPEPVAVPDHKDSGFDSLWDNL